MVFVPFRLNTPENEVVLASISHSNAYVEVWTVDSERHVCASQAPATATVHKSEYGERSCVGGGVGGCV